FLKCLDRECAPRDRGSALRDAARDCRQMKSWQRIVVAIGAVLGALFYGLDSFFPAREPAWLFILALPGVLILAPLIAFMDTDVFLLVPVTNALAFWLLTLSPRIFTRRWSRTALVVVACLSVMAVAG